MHNNRIGDSLTRFIKHLLSDGKIDINHVMLGCRFQITPFTPEMNGTWHFTGKEGVFKSTNERDQRFATSAHPQTQGSSLCCFWCCGCGCCFCGCCCCCCWCCCCFCLFFFFFFLFLFLVSCCCTCFFCFCLLFLLLSLLSFLVSVLVLLILVFAVAVAFY